MNSRMALVALGMFVVGCGAGFQQPPGTQRDPVTYCGGLSRTDCEAASGCYVEPVACIALCVDDGAGNCTSPCASDFRCLAQPVNCDALDEQACEADSRCEFEQFACTQVCRDDGHGGCLPCQVPPSHCRAKTPPSCEALDVNACATDARCEVMAYACPALCIDDGHGGCVPCNAPPASCRTREVSCYGLTPDACDARPDCEFVATACACAPDAVCDCPVMEPSCQPRTTPVSCYGLTPDECDQHSECEFVAHDSCACTGGALCDCPAIEPSCQPRTTCESLSASECTSVSGCGLQEADCACAPGPACECPEARCVTISEPQPDPCAGLDLATCTTDARCEIASLACDTLCRDDGDGGCEPCPDVPFCQLKAEEPPVAGCGAPPAP